MLGYNEPHLLMRQFTVNVHTDGKLSKIQSDVIKYIKYDYLPTKEELLQTGFDGKTFEIYVYYPRRLIKKRGIVTYFGIDGNITSLSTETSPHGRIVPLSE